MDKNTLLADLDYASAIAKDGANTPLLGGPIGLMWGGLLCVTFLGQWLILTQRLSLPESYIGFLWLGFALIGGTGSTILGRKIEAKAGASSVANRVESYVWMMFAAMMGSLFVGVMLNILLAGGNPKLFDFILIAGFAGQGFAYGVTAKMTGLKWLHLAAFAGFTASAICFVALGQAHLYLIAAIATVVTVILPSLKTMKAAG